jgi:mRNA interferase MazF
MKVKQFEVWIADLNPSIGTEPGKVRPVVIVQTDLLNNHHPSSIICPLTTNVINDTEILRVHVKKGSCGLEENCDIMMDQVRAIDNKRLIRKLGVVPVDLAKIIRDNLKILFDIE